MDKYVYRIFLTGSTEFYAWLATVITFRYTASCCSIRQDKIKQKYCDGIETLKRTRDRASCVKQAFLPKHVGQYPDALAYLVRGIVAVGKAWDVPGTHKREMLPQRIKHGVSLAPQRRRHIRNVRLTMVPQVLVHRQR
jgi:hypothetical protein